MTARALRVEAEPRWGSRIEARVELRHGGVAGQAELRDALVREQVAVRLAEPPLARAPARRGALPDLPRRRAAVPRGLQCGYPTAVRPRHAMHELSFGHSRLELPPVLLTMTRF